DIIRAVNFSSRERRRCGLRNGAAGQSEQHQRCRGMKLVRHMLASESFQRGAPASSSPFERDTEQTIATSQVTIFSLDQGICTKSAIRPPGQLGSTGQDRLGALTGTRCPLLALVRHSKKADRRPLSGKPDIEPTSPNDRV